MLYRAAAIQMTSAQDVLINLDQAKHYIRLAVQDGAKLIVLPEMFAIMGLDQADKLKYKEEFGHGLIQDFLKKEAAHYGIWIIGGTIPLVAPEHHDKVFAACLVFDDKGDIVARYDKIHLFDVNLRENQETYNESKTIVPGKEIVVVDSPFGKLGLAVCYDIRFPEMFRNMQSKNAEVIALPAAFTVPTGLAHWDVLVRARAIENQTYIIAAAQTGLHPNARKTYGHSMIVNPWGQVKATLPDATGAVVSDIDLPFLHQLRGDFPVLKHRKYCQDNV